LPKPEAKSGGRPRSDGAANDTTSPSKTATPAAEDTPSPFGRADDLHDVIERLDRVLAGEGPALPDAGTGRGGGSSALDRGLPNDLMERWRHLCETSALLNSSRNEFDPILETVLDIAVDLTRARRGLLFLKQDDGALEARVARDDKKRTLAPAPLDYPRSIVDRVCETGEPLFMPTIADREPSSRSASVKELGLISVLCVPLAIGAEPPPRADAPARGSERRRYTERARDRLLGVIYLDSNVNTYQFREEDLYLFLTLANHATTAILKERLYRQAITDPLTRLFTRRHFERELEDSERRFETARTPFALLMIDIDHFKRVNDRHGHLAGDAVLRELAEAVRRSVRNDDLCFRYGGEELAVLLPETDEKGAVVAAEKIRKRVEETPYYRGEVRATLSIGAASCPAHATTGLELTRKADQALYRAKVQGRNRSEVWSPELGVAAPRVDKLAGIITGHFANDYNNVALLLETFAQLSAKHEVREVCLLAVDKAIEATGAERGALMLADEQGQMTTVVARGRDRRPLELKERFSRSVPERVLRSGEPLYVVTSDEATNQPPSQSIAELGLTTVLCAPLVTDARGTQGADPARGGLGRIGVLYVDARKGADELREAALPFFAALARHLALAIENARLRARLKLENS
jgi:diguanylate cyclase (GGDEF)-like protein